MGNECGECMNSVDYKDLQYTNQINQKGEIIVNYEHNDLEQVNQMTDFIIPQQASKIIQSQTKKPNHILQSKIYKSKINGRPCFYIGQINQNKSLTGFIQAYLLDKKGQSFSVYYQGQIFRGQAEDQNGLLVFNDGTFYFGNITNSKPTGKGKIQTPQGTIYSGDLQNGIPHGSGEWSWGDQWYQGSFNHGIRQGQGRYKFRDGTVFQGVFKNEKPNGKGKLLKEDLITYGIWSDGIMLETLTTKKAPRDNQ